jgi:hypothetical protein
MAGIINSKVKEIMNDFVDCISNDRQDQGQIQKLDMIVRRHSKLWTQAIVELIQMLIPLPAAVKLK